MSGKAADRTQPRVRPGTVAASKALSGRCHLRGGSESLVQLQTPGLDAFPSAGLGTQSSESRKRPLLGMSEGAL